MTTIDPSNFKIEWASLTGANLLDELKADSAQSGTVGMGSYLVAHKKQATSSDQLQIVSAGASLISATAQAPALSAIFGVILLASISPMSLAIISEKEAELLKVLHKLKFGYTVNREHVKAIFKNDPLAEEFINKLCEIGLVRDKGDGALWVKKCILKDLKII